MARKRLLIALGAAAALAVCVAVASLALRPQAGVGELSTAARLALVARWMIVPGLCLLVGIGSTGNRRFFSDEAIDGARSVASRSFEINLRYNQNTLEQTVLAAIAWTGLALALPASRLGLIPALAGLFAVGRASFWIGYLLAPWARAFGLGLTFYPTVAAFIWLAARALG